MELLTGSTAFAEFVADRLDAEEAFRLVDVGCAGGLHSAFRAFGGRLLAWGFDIDATEVARLQANETLQGVRYVHGKVGLPEGHPFLLARAGRPQFPRNPWGRLSIAATLALRSAAAPSGPAPAPSVPPDAVDLPAFLASHGVRDFDFLKIDVDGEDFAILSGLDGELQSMAVLGVGIEVNYFGTDHPTDNTLHNVDRFLRRHGYELFGLTVRRYSAAALPARYVIPGYPAQSCFGRPLQGDAFYVRDVCSPEQSTFAEGLGSAKLAKLAAIFSLGGLPDSAAEILTSFRGRLEPLLDVDAGLDLLTAAARESDMPTNYAEYMKAFAEDSACFYAPAPQSLEEPPAMANQPSPIIPPAGGLTAMMRRLFGRDQRTG